MPNFNGIVVTNSGRTLLAKAQEGKILTFSKMQLGSANDITNPHEKTTVTSPFLTTAIRNINLTPDGSARISTFISNENLTQSYVWREIGLFAIDPDTNEELLFAYKCAGENGETIPAGGGADIVQKIFDIVIKVGTATNITAQIDGSTVFISRQEITQELEICKNEEYKVPSAKLFYNEVKEIKASITNVETISDRIKILTGTMSSNRAVLSLPTGWTCDNTIILTSYIYSKHTNISEYDIYCGDNPPSSTVKHSIHMANYLSYVGKIILETSREPTTLENLCYVIVIMKQ